MSWNAMLMAVSVADADPVLSGPGASVEEVSDADLAAIRDVVHRQLVALRTGALDEAWALCTPAIQRTFLAKESLFATVRERYRVLLTATRARFGDLQLTPVGLGMQLILSEADGSTRHAVYVVARQAGGAWRVHGCLLMHGAQPSPLLAA